jgi:hypothetical protein
VGIEPTLLAMVNAALQRLRETKQVSQIVAAQGLSYSPPAQPAILPPLTPRLLTRRPQEIRRRSQHEASFDPP